MHPPKILDNFLTRNLLGFLLLLSAHAILDWESFVRRSGSDKYTPYIFLIMMYVWIVAHNRLLFERMFLSGQRFRYLLIVLGMMAIFSFNIHVITGSLFKVERTLPHIMSFWLYTVTGLGVFVIYKYLNVHDMPVPPKQELQGPGNEKFIFNSDGRPYSVPFAEVLYFESLENYIRIHTRNRVFIVRQSLKQTEESLPKRLFIRISRSHIVNAQHISRFDEEEIRLNGGAFKIGKVYKKYVAEQLSATLSKNT